MVFKLPCGLEHDDRNSIVEDALAEDNSVQLRVDFVGFENGEDGDGVGRGESCADGERFDKGHRHAFERKECPQPEDHAESPGGDEGARKGEGENAADVAEEICLYHTHHCQHHPIRSPPSVLPSPSSAGGSWRVLSRCSRGPGQTHLMQLIPRIQDNRRQQHVKENLIIKLYQTLQVLSGREPYHQAHEHPRKD